MTTNEPARGATDTDVAELRADIAETRADLGDTVAALADKADIKTRAKTRARQAARDTAAKARDYGQLTAGKIGEQGKRTAVQVRDRGQLAAVRVNSSVRRQPARWAGAGIGVLAAIGAVTAVVAWQRSRRRSQRRAVLAWRALTDRFTR
jgi:hypothetical protein